MINPETLDTVVIVSKTYVILTPLMIVLAWLAMGPIMKLTTYLRNRYKLTVDQFMLSLLTIIQICLLYFSYRLGWLQIIIKHFFG